MEFKQFISIIWERKNIFLFVLFSVVFLSMFWYFVQPEKYRVVFSVDISRNHFQDTEDYKYDQFYRLQADEKFSETIVQWIGSPEMIIDSKNNYKGGVFNIDNLKAERLSANYIRVSFLTKNKDESASLVNSIKASLNEKNSQINNEAGDPNWFSLIFSDFVVARSSFNPWIIFLGSFLIGSILGIFSALFHYYWKSDESRD